MKHNKIFGAAALLVAGAAVGAGATVTQHAMADDGPGAGAESVTMVNIGTDGTAVSCTFTGADANGLVPVLPLEVSGTASVGEGHIFATTGNLPAVSVGQGTDQPIEVKVGEIPADAGSGVVTVGAGVIGSTADGEVISSDVREGTPEECAAMHDDGVVAVRNAVPTDDAAKEAANSTEP